MVTARPGLHVLYRGRYDDAAGVLRIAVLSVAVASLPVDGVLKARARTGTLLVLYAIKLLITWPLLALGFHYAGLVGCISAHVAVEILTRATQIAIISFDLRVPMTSLLGGRVLVRSLAVATLAGMGAAAAVLIIPRAIWACVAAGIVTTSIVGLELFRRRTQASLVPADVQRAA